jgi:hypothetical protein
MVHLVQVEIDRVAIRQRAALYIGSDSYEQARRGFGLPAV